MRKILLGNSGSVTTCDFGDISENVFLTMTFKKIILFPWYHPRLLPQLGQLEVTAASPKLTSKKAIFRFL